METAAPHHHINPDLADLEEALDTVLGRPSFAFSPDELADRLMVLQRLRTKLDALVSITTTDVASSGAAPAAGVRTVAQLVAVETNVDPAQVRFDDRQGHFLGQFPAFEQAATAGWLTTAHIELLRKAHNKRTHPHLVEGQHHLAESARWCSYNDYQIVIAEFLIGADPDGELPKDHNHNNQLNVTARPDGTYTINGRLDPLTGQAIKTAVDHRTQQLRQQHTTGDNQIPSTVGPRPSSNSSPPDSPDPTAQHQSR